MACVCESPENGNHAENATCGRNKHWKGPSYSVRIEATFGSRFQRGVAIKNLNSLLAAWKELVEAKHTKNAIRVIRSRE